MWVGRATVFFVGLSVILALMLGLASTALGANGDFLRLESLKNVATKTTALVGKAATGSSLIVKNPSGGSALDLQVGDLTVDPATKNTAPMKVNSQAKVADLNADQLDGVGATQFAQKLDSGMITLDPTSIPAQSCGFLASDPPGAGDLSNDVVVVTPDSIAANQNLVFGASRANQNPQAFRVRMCNITTSSIDPPSATYYWMIFHLP